MSAIIFCGRCGAERCDCEREDAKPARSVFDVLEPTASTSATLSSSPRDLLARLDERLAIDRPARRARAKEARAANARLRARWDREAKGDC